MTPIKIKVAAKGPIFNQKLNKMAGLLGLIIAEGK